MPYPLSSDVTDGQPTSYLHYNNLRADAIRFGQAAADVVSLGAGLARYIDNVVLAPLATNRFRVPYDALKPPTLMIDGHLCQATADVDLAALTFSGLAATWYIFANWTAASTTFTLSANTSMTEASGQRRIAAVNWDGAAVDYDSLIMYAGTRKLYYAHMTRAAAQSINNTTLTAISWDTEDADLDTLWAGGSPTRLTIVHPGIYIVNFNAVLASNCDYIEITNNASSIARSTGPVLRLSVTALQYFAAGDYVEGKVYQSTGGAVNTSSPTTIAIAALAA